MDNERYNITIYPSRLNGKKTTQKGVAYYEVVDNNRSKFRVYDQGLYNHIKLGVAHDVEVSDFSGKFTNEKSKEIEYTIKTIHNILNVPLDESESLDRVLMESEISPQRKMSTNVSEQVEDKPDWDAIARGKVKHGVATAV